jgi:hypothetical protein
MLKVIVDAKWKWTASTVNNFYLPPPPRPPKMTFVFHPGQAKATPFPFSSTVDFSMVLRNGLIPVFIHQHEKWREIKTITSSFKGTVSRDFLLLVFFLNQFPPSF